jgi:hypothetical protein
MLLGGFGGYDVLAPVDATTGKPAALVFPFASVTYRYAGPLKSRPALGTAAVMLPADQLETLRIVA